LSPSDLFSYPTQQHLLRSISSPKSSQIHLLELFNHSQLLSLSTFSKVSVEKGEERLHFGIESLERKGIQREARRKSESEAEVSGVNDVRLDRRKTKRLSN